MQAVDEVVVLERIELIARLGVCYESQAKDKDIALIWISELAGEMKTSIAGDEFCHLMAGSKVASRVND